MFRFSQGTGPLADAGKSTPELKRNFHTLQQTLKKLSQGGEGASSQERLIIFDEEVYAACCSWLDANRGNVLRAGEVSVLKTAHKPKHRWLVLTSTHLDLYESSDSKNTVKSYPLLGCDVLRAPPKAEGQHLLQVTSTEKSILVNIAENVNDWLEAILRARLLTLKRLFDACPLYRSFLLGPLMKTGGGGRTMTRETRKTLAAQQLSNDLFKFGFLEFERVTASLSIAHETHETYVGVVEKILARLHSQSKEREALRAEINSLETNLADRQKAAQSTGRNLSLTVGEALSSISTLHAHTVAVHKELQATALKLNETGAQPTPEQLEKLRAFRQGLSFLGVGLALDAPLKSQLGELEGHDEQIGQEIQVLQARREHLQKECETTECNIAELSAIMTRAGNLRNALGAASSVTLDGSRQSSEIDSRAWVEKVLESMPEDEMQASTEFNALPMEARAQGAAKSPPPTIDEEMQNQKSMALLGLDEDAFNVANKGRRGSVKLPLSIEEEMQNQKSMALLGLDEDSFNVVMKGRVGSAQHQDSTFSSLESSSSSQSSQVAVVESDRPTDIVRRILTQHCSGNLEMAVLHTFPYFMKPLQLWELINSLYCAGPSFSDGPQESAEIERRMASVRVRTLNVLRKWAEMHPYHFLEDPHLNGMLRNFLSTARLVGHGRIAEMIEFELKLAAATPDSDLRASLRTYAPPIFREGYEKATSIAILSHVLPEELARQLTLMDQALYRKLQVREFLKLAFMSKRAAELCPNLKRFSHQFNEVASVVSTSILAENDVKSRHKVVSFWIKVLKHLRLLNNYESTLAVVAGLSTTPINRLKLTWAEISTEEIAYYEDCRSLMEKNFARLRLELDTCTPPAIPYLGAYQRDLVYLDEAPTMRDDLVNLAKLKSIASVLQNCLAFQGTFYWFDAVSEIQQIVTHMPVFPEKEAHAISLRLEPREDASAKKTLALPIAGKSQSKVSSAPSLPFVSTTRKVVNRFAALSDEELPRLPTFPPPLEDRTEYKEYMQLRYEYKSRNIPLDGATGFANVSKVDEGGGFLRIKNDIEDTDGAPGSRAGLNSSVLRAVSNRDGFASSLSSVPRIAVSNEDDFASSSSSNVSLGHRRARSTGTDVVPMLDSSANAPEKMPPLPVKKIALSPRRGSASRSTKQWPGASPPLSPPLSPPMSPSSSAKLNPSLTVGEHRGSREGSPKLGSRSSHSPRKALPQLPNAKKN